MKNRTLYEKIGPNYLVFASAAVLFPRIPPPPPAP
uniref:Uncharacterized protein n=1 Tax=Nelumbo nucifera TaxID=4432 RepID=A0A822Z3S0_NELNU|nr:TPA_asm: hypothetical protein HUJ06_015347 [Nelumbo nucifera]